VLCAALAVVAAAAWRGAAEARASRGFVSPHAALYWERLANDRVRCLLCPRRCTVSPGGRGHCGVRENRGGAYFTLAYGNPCAVHVDPIEKKPLFHYLPGSTAFSVATAGCNLDCGFCQNWEISQSRPEDLVNEEMTPEQFVDAALASGSRVVAYTYSEPTVFYEYMLDCAKLAHERGLRNVYHSNGYINEAPLRELCRYLDAANVDLKGFTDDYYRDMCGASLAPVLRSLKVLRDEGVHLEITTLLIPGRNDDPQTLRLMCRWIRRNLGPDVPLHFSRFHPQYRLTDVPPTPVERLELAREIAMEEGLEYVYIGNVPGHEANSTYCPVCGAAVIRRIGYEVDASGLRWGVCRTCGTALPGLWG
jgi:pyruvate formate lyase activating enzyme